MKTSARKLVSHAELERKLKSLGDTFTLLEKAEAVRREEILVRWNRAKLGGWELGMIADKATAIFILTVQDRFGLIVSRASLFNWERRYRQRGLIALIDRRKIVKRARKSRGIEGRS